MDPNAFVAEVYRRMSLRHRSQRQHFTYTDIIEDSRVVQAAFEYAPLLPADRGAPILDLGFGQGWFLGACLKLGYTNLSGADFAISNKEYVRAWQPDFITLHEIEQDIGSFLATRPEQYSFIHMSHVIEHIPKYSLLWVGDNLYRSLRHGGTCVCELLTWKAQRRIQVSTSRSRMSVASAAPTLRHCSIFVVLTISASIRLEPASRA